MQVTVVGDEWARGALNVLEGREASEVKEVYLSDGPEEDSREFIPADSVDDEAIYARVLARKLSTPGDPVRLPEDAVVISAECWKQNCKQKERAEKAEEERDAARGSLDRMKDEQAALLRKQDALRAEVEQLKALSRSPYTETNFAPGDVVRLKSGGPKMTVEAVKSGLETMVRLVWMGEDGHLEVGDFPPAALLYVGFASSDLDFDT